MLKSALDHETIKKRGYDKILQKMLDKKIEKK